MNEVIVDEAFCKGCGLCVEACPVSIMSLNLDEITPKGYHPAYCKDISLCTGCTSCALVCPDIAICVLRKVK